MEKTNKPSKDSQRALPRNKRKRVFTHQPDGLPPEPRITPTMKEREGFVKAGQRDMFDDPIPEAEIRYYQPLLTGLLHIVDLARNMVVTNRQRMIHGAA